MKLIRSVIRPDKLDELKRALGSINVTAFTVAEVHDYAPEHAHTIAWMNTLHLRHDRVRLDLTAVVEDDNVDEVVQLIVKTARTKGQEDGHVYVLPVEHRYTIHTGFRESP